MSKSNNEKNMNGELNNLENKLSPNIALNNDFIDQ